MVLYKIPTKYLALIYHKNVFMFSRVTYNDGVNFKKHKMESQSKLYEKEEN